MVAAVMHGLNCSVVRSIRKCCPQLTRTKVLYFIQYLPEAKSQKERDEEKREEANPYGFHEMQLSLVEQCLPISFKPKSTI